MTNAYKSKRDGEKWGNDGCILTPYASDMVQTQREAAGFFNVLPSSSTTCFVQGTRGLAASYRVNVAKTTCTGAYIRQYGHPCRHLIAALIKLKRLDTIFLCLRLMLPRRLLHPRVRGYGRPRGRACSRQGASSADVLPLIPTLTTSRQKKIKRIASRGEKPNSATTRSCVKCSLCGQTGHRTRNYTND